MKTVWCIVDYLGGMVMYYEGYYAVDKLNGTPMRPVISSNFEDALKLSSREEAEKIRRRMNHPTFKVEEHSY